MTIKLVGVRFKPAGKVYDFDAGAFVLNRGDSVIVETEQGLGLGFIAIPPTYREDNEGRIFKKVFRMATAKDFGQRDKNAEIERKAHCFCMDCIRDLRLEMNLFSVESTFDGNKLTFFFTAEGRVDFRELVKILVREFRTRIEMRQVGIRNQAKMCGGLGRCGRVLCCATFIEKFEPVSIRMAKEQGLSLNPTKISGQCGRLMCCLTFENETYRNLKADRLRENWPRVGRMVHTHMGKGKVIRHNVIGNRIAVRLEGGQETEIDVAAILSDSPESSQNPPSGKTDGKSSRGPAGKKADRAPEKSRGKKPGRPSGPFVSQEPLDLSEEDLSEESLSEEDLPEEDLSEESMSEEDVPEEDSSEEDSSEEDSSEEDSSGNDLTKEDPLEDDSSEDDLPKDDSPEDDPPEDYPYRDYQSGPEDDPPEDYSSKDYQPEPENDPPENDPSEEKDLKRKASEQKDSERKDSERKDKER